MIDTGALNYYNKVNTMASKKYTYRNNSKTTQSLVGYGTVVAGGIVESDKPIYNQNFVLIDAGRMANVEAPVSQPEVDINVKKGKK